MKAASVYLILDVTVKDREKFMQYVEGHKPSMQQYGGKLLFRSNDMEPIEGTWSPKLVVVHEWPSEEAFRRWYDSKEYAPWKELRKDAMDMNMVLARKMPESGKAASKSLNAGRPEGTQTEQPSMQSILKQTFDTVSTGYDDKALRFFPESAKNLANLLKLRGNEQVLDVACGTGHASLAIAGMLPNGKITSVDFSAGMLAQARAKAAELKIGNIEFIEMDMQKLEFPDSHFDAAVCAFGIFFVEDMETQLAHIASKVKPGGRIMITNFLESYFSPLKELFFDRLASFGVQRTPQAWKRIAHEDGCRDLFAKAGLTDIHVEVRNVGYYLNDADDWWSIVWNAGFRRMVSQLSERDQQKFKREHLREVAARKIGEGIWLDVGVLYTSGTKA